MRTAQMTFSSLLALSGCTAQLAEASFPTGSQTAVGSADHSAVYAVDEDGGRLARYSTAGGDTELLKVGSRPSRVARLGTRVFVTLRGERAVAEVSDVGGEMSVVRTVKVGAEPVGIVAREDGTKLYVALSQEDAIVELDGTTLTETRRWSAEGHPTWVALHPSGDALFAASAMGGHLYRIDLDNDAIEELDVEHPTGGGESGEEQLTRRFTGDIAITGDGKEFAIPALYVDNLSPVDEPSEDGVSSGSYASSPSITVSRFNPALVLGQLDEHGSLSDTENVFLAGFSPIKPGGEMVRSYPSSATYSPSADIVVVTMESSATAIVLSRAAIAGGGDTGFSFDSGGGSTSLGSAGFTRAAGVYVSMNAGPRGVAFTSDSDMYVHNFLERSLREVDLAEARSRLAARLGGTGSDIGAELVGGDSHALHDSSLSEIEQEGRRLFYTAVDSNVAVDGAGVSCSTCHFEGRNDGLTWTFADGVRQTPSLASAVSVTAPYTWTDGVSSIAAEAMITSQGRMGGVSLSLEETAEIEAFIAKVPEVDHKDRGSVAEAALRGKVLFENDAVGCAACHSGSAYTDNASHALYGLDSVNTPSLVGVAATAPYLHSGTSATLRDVLDTARTGQMGDTSMLSESELDDLESYVRTL